MKSVTVICIIFFLISTSCDKGDEWEAKRRIINNTNHFVDLEIFGDNVLLSYSINPMDTLEISGTCTCCVPKKCNIGWSQLEYGTLIFNNTLKLTFVGEPDNCGEKAINVDPFYECHGYTRTQEGKLVIYTYVITQEDYSNADPI